MAETVYDLAVIGGGIAGAGIAREAAMRGARTLLFEKHSFGSGTSSKSSKLIHGGLRYLDVAWREACRGRFSEAFKNFRFVSQSLRESHRLRTIAPDRVLPLRLLVPVYRGAGHGRLTVFFGTILYGLMSKFAGGPAMPRLLSSKKAVLKIVPALKEEGLSGGVLIWDHMTDDAALVRETIRSAVRSGAEAFEHAAVRHYRYDETRHAFEIEVERAGEAASVFYARKLVNASGPWIDKVRAASGERQRKLLEPVAGSHITVRRFVDQSIILETADGRVFFVIVREDGARVGTTEWLHADPDTLSTPDVQVEYLLQELRNYFPSMGFKKEDVLGKDSGIRPLVRPNSPLPVSDIPREHEFIAGPHGVIHAVGIKLTDHRRAAEELLDRLLPELRVWNPAIERKSRTASEKL